MNSHDWPQEMVIEFGQRMKAIRSAREPRMTAQQLADLVTELGTPMTRTTVSDLENGRRGAHLTVPELLAISEALKVAPLDLLYPGDGETASEKRRAFIGEGLISEIMQRMQKALASWSKGCEG